jgi:hypothetical protein
MPRRPDIRHALPALIILAPLLSACASAQPPTAQLAVAGSTLSDAERAGAVRDAPVELNLARQKLAAAQAATRQENYDEARRLATEAEADAKLAEVKTRATLAEQSAAAVQRGATTLQRELSPAPTPSPAAPSSTARQ